MSIDLIVFGEDWGSHPSSTQHLFKNLLGETEVMWINSLGLRSPKLNLRDMKRLWTKLKAMTHKPVMRKTTGPQILNPTTFPFPGSRVARLLNQTLLLNKISPLIRQQDKAPLLWTSLPSAVDVVGNLGERAAIYYCGDDFSALDGVDHGPVTEMEMELADKCQLIITASNELATKFPQNKTIVLPHGVDCELFGHPVKPALDLPSGQVAGFYGAIAGWFDQTLYIETARLLPDWAFLLLGPQKTDIRRLLKEPNIIWLGARDHSELPGYSQHWDVGLLPFKRNAQIEACNPLKLREYLAAGSPVVSTDYPALDGYRDLIKVAATAETFASAIVELHQQKYHKKLMREIRQNRVSSESWKAKSDQLKDLFSRL